MFADADRRGWRTTERRRLADLEFLEKLKTAPLAELCTLLTQFSRKNDPRWKWIATWRAYLDRLSFPCVDAYL